MMASDKNSLCSVFLLLTLVSNLPIICVHGSPQVPCYFIFGDSLADSGNNNMLDTKAKANYSPYGVDFLGGVTGRFTNGKTMVDVIASFLGFDQPIPSFATARGRQILTGVNYASGSAGIRDETGNHLGAHVSFNRQLINHQTTLKSLAAHVENVRGYVGKCLYTVGIGSNDYINNYFLAHLYNSSRQYNPDQYAEALVTQYTSNLLALYNAGARKFALIGLGPIGCIPQSMSTRRRTSCVQEMNNAVVIFNSKLKPLVDKLSSQLAGSRFIYINSFVTASAFPNIVADVECCRIREDGQCDQNQAPCQNRNDYVFWDGFHPTEATNKISGAKAYNSSDPSDAYPFSISSLIRQN